MNIELLSKMVKELLLDNDVVNLPTLGSFVAEIVPAAFSDSGHTINPPYRKLYFRDNIEKEDDLLVRLYAAENNVTEEVASDVINGFIAEVKGLLNSRKSIVLPELGRLRATKENNYFFVPFENVNIYPEGEGLEPVPLKIRTVQTEASEETTPVETTETPSEEATNAPAEETPAEATEESVAPTETTPVEAPAGPVVVETPADTSAEETPTETPPEATETPAEPAETATDGETVILNGVEVVRIDSSSETPKVPTETKPTEAPATSPTGISKGWLRAIIVIGSILLAFALFILLFILLSHIFPAFFDRLLWS